MVDFMYLCQLYKCREIAKIKWIKGNTNLADFMTKSKVYNVLKQLIDMNKVNISVIYTSSYDSEDERQYKDTRN